MKKQSATNTLPEEEKKTAYSSYKALGLPAKWKIVCKEYTLLEAVGSGSFG